MKKFLFSNLIFVKAFLFSLVLYIFLTLGVLFIYKANALFIAHRAQASFTAGIEAEKNNLITSGNSFAANEQLKAGIKTKDSYGVLSTLNTLNNNKIKGVAVADKNGIIFSRTVTSFGRGDDSFIIGPLGRGLVRTGTTTFSIEKNSFDPSELIISSARYVKDGSEIIGALYTTDFIDNAYVESFAKKYLPGDAMILFYSRGHGIYGENVTDEPTQKILSAFFYPESDWLTKGKNNSFIRFPDGRYFAVINTTFPGLEHPPGGALVLVPIYAFLPLVRFLIWAAVLVFCFLHIRGFLQSSKTQTQRHHYYVALLVLLFLAAVLIAINYASRPAADTLGTKKLVLYNSVLSLDPQTVVFDKSYLQTVSVRVNTGPEEINAVGVQLGYDPALVSVSNISDTNSVCSQVIEKTIDAVKGEINFSCIIADPAFTGIGTVLTLSLQAHTSNPFDLWFLPESQVLANDGLGTNVLRTTTNGNYKAIDSSNREQINIYSPTHPNSGQWYAERKADFIWNGSPTSTYAYLLDTATSSTLSLAKVVTGQKISLSVPSDGVYYFHLAEVNSQKIETPNVYKVQIDTTPPAGISIKTSSTSIQVGDLARLELSATDTASGLQKNFYLSVNKGLFLPTQKSVFVPFSSPGKNILTVRAYDNAGNYSDNQTTIQVNGNILQNIFAPLLAPK